MTPVAWRDEPPKVVAAFTRSATRDEITRDEVFIVWDNGVMFSYDWGVWNEEGSCPIPEDRR